MKRYLFFEHLDETDNEMIENPHGKWCLYDDIKDSLIGEQVGWYDPGSKRFCYLDEKEYSAEHFRGYTVPVYLPKSPKE